MKKFAPFALLSSLAACSGGETPTDDPAATEEAVSDYAGTAFEVTNDEGTAFQVYLNDDDTYYVTSNGEPFQSGVWRENASGALCLTSGAEDNREEACWTASEPDAGEVVTYTSDTGVTLSGRGIQYTRYELAEPAE